MKLVELYLDEIRHQLPPKNREDILKEIRSTLMDMIEDRNPNPGGQPDQSTIKTVLAEFGSPRKVAKQYGAQNYLIGPRFFPIYVQVLKIVLIVIAALNVLGLVVAIVNQSTMETGLATVILEAFASLFGSLFTAFGVVTFSFAAIERSAPEEWQIDMEEEWDPEQLHKLEDKERVSLAGLAIEITMWIVFIALLNFFIDRIGIYYLSDTGWVSAPILNDNFLRYIPLITASYVLGIALNLYLIRKGFWDKIATIGKVLINAFTIAIHFVIITGPDIITVSPSALQALNFDMSFTAGGLTQILNIVVDVLLSLAIFGLVVDSIKRLVETFIKGGSTPIEIQVD